MIPYFLVYYWIIFISVNNCCTEVSTDDPFQSDAIQCYHQSEKFSWIEHQDNCSRSLCNGCRIKWNITIDSIWFCSDHDDMHQNENENSDNWCSDDFVFENILILTSLCLLLGFVTHVGKNRLQHILYTLLSNTKCKLTFCPPNQSVLVHFVWDFYWKLWCFTSAILSVFHKLKCTQWPFESSQHDWIKHEAYCVHVFCARRPAPRPAS